MFSARKTNIHTYIFIYVRHSVSVYFNTKQIEEVCIAVCGYVLTALPTPAIPYTAHLPTLSATSRPTRYYSNANNNVLLADASVYSTRSLVLLEFTKIAMSAGVRVCMYMCLLSVCMCVCAYKRCCACSCTLSVSMLLHFYRPHSLPLPNAVIVLVFVLLFVVFVLCFHRFAFAHFFIL